MEFELLDSMDGWTNGFDEFDRNQWIQCFIEAIGDCWDV
jgi:hypothetical protein